jgi:hypothetical protein
MLIGVPFFNHKVDLDIAAEWPASYRKLGRGAMADIQFTVIKEADNIRHHYPNLTIAVSSTEEAISHFTERSKDSISFWAIFDHPVDFPENFVVRENIVKRTGKGQCAIFISPYVMFTTTLEDAQKLIPPGLFRMPKQEGDPINLVETWF